MSSAFSNPSGSAIAPTHLVPKSQAIQPVVTGNSQLLKLAQAANILNLNPRTLSRWAMCGKIRAFRTGNYLRFDLKDVLALVEEVQS